MVKMLIIVFFTVMISANAFSANISFDYSPGSIYFGETEKKEGMVNLKDGNAWGFTDKMGDCYFSKMSLSITTNPEKLDIPYADNRFKADGIFFDVMHKELELEPINIKYLENGGRTHAVTYLLGYTYQMLFSNSMEGFTLEVGLGFARTYFYKDGFGERAGSNNFAPVLKVGMGYKVKTSGSLFIDFGIDVISPALTYHEVEGGSYSRFLHGGLYPYVGISF